MWVTLIVVVVECWLVSISGTASTSGTTNTTGDKKIWCIEVLWSGANATCTDTFTTLKFATNLVAVNQAV